MNKVFHEKGVDLKKWFENNSIDFYIHDKFVSAFSFRTALKLIFKLNFGINNDS